MAAAAYVGNSMTSNKFMSCSKPAKMSNGPNGIFEALNIKDMLVHDSFPLYFISQ